MWPSEKCRVDKDSEPLCEFKQMTGLTRRQFYKSHLWALLTRVPLHKCLSQLAVRLAGLLRAHAWVVANMPFIRSETCQKNIAHLVQQPPFRPNKTLYVLSYSQVVFLAYNWTVTMKFTHKRCFCYLSLCDVSKIEFTDFLFPVKRVSDQLAVISCSFCCLWLLIQYNVGEANQSAFVSTSSLMSI